MLFDVGRYRRGHIKEQELRLPLEDMDLIVGPAGEELAGAHGDEMLFILK